MEGGAGEDRGMSDDITAAEPMDIYADANGKLWRVVATCHEPTVTLEEVEPSGHTSDPPADLPTGAQTWIGPIGPVKGSFIRRRMNGGMRGLMFNGFRRVLRPGVPHDR